MELLNEYSIFFHFGLFTYSNRKEFEQFRPRKEILILEYKEIKFCFCSNKTSFEPMRIKYSVMWFTSRKDFILRITNFSSAKRG